VWFSKGSYHLVSKPSIASLSCKGVTQVVTGIPLELVKGNESFAWTPGLQSTVRRKDSIAKYGNFSHNEKNGNFEWVL